MADSTGKVDDDKKSTSTAAENITALSAISKDIPLLLQSAGSAISILTNKPASDLIADSASDQIDALAKRKAAFTVQTRAFHETLSRIQIALRAQADALVDSGLIPADAPRAVPGDKEETTNSGLGGLDVGFLNGRARDVAIGKEGELVAEAKRLVEKIVNEKEENLNGDKMEEDG